MASTMADELTVCAAAFFRNKGRDVVAEKEFTMGISLDLRWMSVKESKALMDMMVSSGVLELKDGFLRPKFDGSAMDIPMAYRPSPELIASVTSGNKIKKAAEGLFPEMVSMAEKSGMRKAGYIAACNALQKKLDVDIEVAGVIVLRDIGAGVSSLYARVRDAVLKK
jgi:hypothetical protein